MEVTKEKSTKFSVCGLVICALVTACSGSPSNENEERRSVSTRPQRRLSNVMELIANATPLETFEGAVRVSAQGYAVLSSDAHQLELYAVDETLLPERFVVFDRTASTADARGVLYLATQLIAQLKPGASLSDFDALNKNQGVTAKALGNRTYRLTRREDDQPSIAEYTNFFETYITHQSLFASVEPDHVFVLDDEQSAAAATVDPLQHEQWALDVIHARQAWARVDRKVSGPPLYVAVVDTGIDASHEDFLQENGESIVDTRYGRDFYTGSPEGEDPDGTMDLDGHGTHVAGIIAALRDNGKGVAGLAQNIRIIPVKMFNDARLSTESATIAATNYVAELQPTITQQESSQIVVSSNSWGRYQTSQAMRDAVTAVSDQGILFVAAAGNDGKNTDYTPHFPSGHPQEAVIAVGASDAADLPVSWSNYGRHSVDLFAPGKNILSARLGSRYVLSSGTSMATPFVSAACVLIKQYFGDAITPQQIKQRVLGSVAPSLDFSKSVSQGRLDLDAALATTAYPRIGAVTINDDRSLSGLNDNDGFAEPGERVRVQVEIINSGSEDFYAGQIHWGQTSNHVALIHSADTIDLSFDPPVASFGGKGSVTMILDMTIASNADLSTPLTREMTFANRQGKIISQDRLKLDITKMSRVSGRLLDDQGGVVSGAVIELDRQTQNGFQRVALVRSDTQGRYDFGSHVKGNYLLKIRPAVNFPPTERLFQLSDDVDKVVDLVFTRYELSGRVQRVASASQQVATAGAAVFLSGVEGPAAVTNAQGAFSITYWLDERMRGPSIELTATSTVENRRWATASLKSLDSTQSIHTNIELVLHQNAFQWIDLEEISGDNGYLQSISDQREVVGVYLTSADTLQTTAFYWRDRDKDGVASGDESLVLGTDNRSRYWPIQISNGGFVVGGQQARGPFGTDLGWFARNVYTHNPATPYEVTLLPYPNLEWINLEAVNSNGTIVGSGIPPSTSSFPGSSAARRALIYEPMFSQDGSAGYGHPLLVLGEYPEAADANGINDNGMAMGSFSFGGNIRTWYWQPSFGEPQLDRGIQLVPPICSGANDSRTADIPATITESGLIFGHTNLGSCTFAYAPLTDQTLRFPNGAYSTVNQRLELLAGSQSARLLHQFAFVQNELQHLGALDLSSYLSELSESGAPLIVDLNHCGDLLGKRSTRESKHWLLKAQQSTPQIMHASAGISRVTSQNRVWLLGSAKGCFPDGPPRYSWRQVAGPTGGAAFVGSSDQPRAQVEFSRSGIYRFALEVEAGASRQTTEVHVWYQGNEQHKLYLPVIFGPNS